MYTEYRSASMATIFSPAAILGVGAAIGIAAHNLATYDPDYEIGKNKVAGTVTVKHMKWPVKNEKRPTGCFSFACRFFSFPPVARRPCRAIRRVPPG